jgi:hypothetical protein
MISELTTDWRRSWVWFGVVAGVVAGTAVAFIADQAVGTLVVVLALVAFARSSHRAERLVALYWVAFAAYSVVFYGITIRFGFYPFYVAFLVTIAVALGRAGLRIDPTVAWLYLGYMVTMLWSLLAFPDPVDSEVIQRILAHLVGALVLLQFRSKEGLRLGAQGAILSGLAVAGYVIYRGIETGFGYRGGLEANPNVAATLIAFGLVCLIALMLDVVGTRRDAWRWPLFLLALAVMVYGTMLLAPRGAILAIGSAVALMTLRSVVADWRRLLIVPLLVGIAAGGLLLPGGQTLVDRFTSPEEELDTAGSRIPIWNATIENLTSGGIRELLIGHGFNSSQAVVERTFPGQPSTHNTYLQVMYEFGAASLLLFVALLAYLMWRAWQMPSRNGLIMIGLLTVLVIENFSGNTAESYPYWIAMGYIAGINTWGDT